MTRCIGPDRFFTDRDGAVSIRLRKSERNDFSRDWSPMLGAGEILSSSAWVSDLGGIDDDGKSETVATVWLDEETLALEGAPFATMTNTIETTDGRRDSWTVRVYPPEV